METIVLNKVYSANDVKLAIRDKRNAFFQELPEYCPHYVVLAEWQKRLLNSEIDIYLVNEDGFLSYRIYDLIICVSPKVKEIEDIEVF